MSRKERERIMAETSIRALPSHHLIKEPHYPQGGNDYTLPYILLPFMWPPLPSPLLLKPHPLPPTLLPPPYQHRIPLEPTIGLRERARTVYWRALRWGVLPMPLPLWVLFVTQFKMYCRGCRDLYRRRSKLREILTQCHPNQSHHLWTWLIGPSMICWCSCIGWEGLTWKTSNQVQRTNNGWGEEFEKVFGYDRLFAIQYHGAGGTVKII